MWDDTKTRNVSREKKKKSFYTYIKLKQCLKQSVHWTTDLYHLLAMKIKERHADSNVDPNRVAHVR